MQIVTPAHAMKRRWRPSWVLIAGVAIAIIGLGLGTYPFAASWTNEVNHAHAAQAYVGEIENDADKAEQLNRAVRYNEALNMGVDLLAHERIPDSTGTMLDPELDYYSILSSSPSKIMARLRIESIGVDLPVYHGTDDDTLLRGAGHLEGSSLPVGGSNTHAVLTAHRGLAQATMFDNLPKLQIGETFTLEVFGEVLTYRVINRTQVEPEDTESLRVDSGRDLVTLVTCTPLGVNTHRMLVTGERVYPTPAADLAAAGEPSGIPGFPWWAVISGAILVTILVVFWRLGYHNVPAAMDAPAATKTPTVTETPANTD